MDKLKKTNIEQGAQKCPSVSTNNCPDNGPFFNTDYFSHVVVQTIEELNSIPCKLRQDGMVATVVQEDYSNYQLQTSRTGFGICDNNAWVKISIGDEVFNGGNLFLFQTEEEANEFMGSTQSKEGQIIYISDLDSYFKFDGQDGLTDAFPNKLDKPTTNNTNQFVILGDGSTASKNDFGKVDTVNNIEPDNSKNVNLGIDDILLKGMPLEETLDDNKKVLLYDDTGKSYWKSLSEVGKVKTVNNQEPDENGNIKIEEEFVKNGGGWSLKYRVDNPTFYGAIGQEAVDFSISKSVNTKMPERFSYGANGFNTAVFGIYNSAMDAGSLVSGVQNRSQGQCNNIMSSNSTIIQDKGTGNFTKKDNGIYSGSNNTIENNRNSTVTGGGNNRMVGKISPVNNMYDMYNAILGGNGNTITNSISNIILGGTLNNIIGEEKSRENESYNSNNAIIGGYKNKIITAAGTNRQAYSSVIFGGEENIAQGHYNMVAGYSNHAVTAGETLFGFYGTVQNTSLSGYDFISDSRMFNVGIGESTTQGVVTRKDGLSVFRNGLVTAPTASNSNIENNLKAVTTKEFVDNKISNFSLSTNWTNPSQRMSGLLDKSADATYNQLLGVDSNGYVAKVGLNAVTNAVAKSSDAQKDAFRLASRKSTENYNTSAPIILIANPFIIKNINNYPVNLVITGNNLFIDKASSSLQIRRIKDVNGNPISDVWIDVTSSINVSEINNSLLAIYHNFKSFPAGYYEMKLTNQIGLSNLTSPLFMIVDNYEDTPTKAFEVISNSGNLLSQSTIGYNSTETTIISGLNGGMIFKDLVDIVDGNVNSITTIEISHTNPTTDYDMGEIVAGFTDQAIITPTTMPIVGVKAFYKDWSVRCSDVKNNKDLGISGLGQNNQLNIFKIHLFIKDGTYSILSESHSKVSEGFYTDLSKLNFMLNITRSTRYNGTAPFTVSITSLKKIN